jgi:hypothetical protein
MSTATNDDPRAEYIAGLRALADVLEANPDIDPPGNQMTWVTSWLVDPKAETRKIIRAIGGKWDKRGGGTDGSIMVFESRISGLPVEILCQREQVCERVVVGTRQVTKTVPAPDAPMVEVTETVEDIRWECHPLLAESGAVA